MTSEQIWEEMLALRNRWLDEKASDDSGWPPQGIAIEGDFAGIQGYILKPVPGAKGAAKRLRGRSLQVSALTALLAQEVEQLFPNAEIFYSAGGRFLVHAPASPDWKAPLDDLQRKIDEWMGLQFRGEVVFHLASAQFTDGKIPRDGLRKSMTDRKMRPLAGFLIGNGAWDETRFLRTLDDPPSVFKCPACLTTANKPVIQKDEDDTQICEECDRDKKLGQELANSPRAMLVRDAGGQIPFLDGARYTIGNSGTISAHVIHHMPRDERNKPLTLEQVAEKSIGTRKWLGYLRLDADGVGSKFRELENKPARIRALSKLLHTFFRDCVQQKLGQKYHWIYPVYGGGDDLFVIGPWNVVIDFAAELATEFHIASQGKLSFSAGIALSKPKQHILSKSEEAESGLNEHAKMKPGKKSIHVLGETFSWTEFHGVLQAAYRVAGWYERGLIPSSLLQLLIELQGQTRMAIKAGDAAGAVRYRPILHYQAHRNLKNDAQKPVLEWFRKLIDRQKAHPDASWSAMGFTARYALLASRKEKE